MMSQAIVVLLLLLLELIFSFLLFQLKSLENNYHDHEQTRLLPNQDDLRITLFRLSWKRRGIS